MRRSLLVFGEYDDWKTPAISWSFGAETPAMVSRAPPPHAELPGCGKQAYEWQFDCKTLEAFTRMDKIASRFNSAGFRVVISP